MRKIIHIDMDAFFASVEQRDNPEWRGLPVVVGGAPSRRGVVAAASYEARRFGIRSAMSSARALQRCPHVVFVPPRFEVYRAVSEQIHGIFAQYTDMIEPLSLDEAYLDVSACDVLGGSATRIAEALRADIFRATQLTASAGVSYNKFLAKMASDQNKPDGLCVIHPQRGEAFVGELPIGDFHGVGPATEKKMQQWGIRTGADLRKKSREWLAAHFGKSAGYYYDIARGVDERPVRTHRIRKSIGSETTFAQDLNREAAMLAVLEQRLEKVLLQLEKKRWNARTLTVKVKYADFTQVTRSKSLDEPSHGVSAFRRQLPELLRSTEARSKPVRLLGVTLSNLSPQADSSEEEPSQYPLF
ncbi:DNA-directed DNA polymerase protein [gamma proteobacterium HTCC5015]|nr:DNA-directed DNA polymerase protein [gamma proteobacterium HTCC5015]